MKLIKLVHTLLGIIPFVWLVSFLILIIIGTIHLGYIPKYGNPIDPYALGLDWINIIEVWLLLFGFISILIWPLFSLILYFIFNNRIEMNKISIIFFSIGVVGFILVRYLFTDVFLWVMD